MAHRLFADPAGGSIRDDVEICFAGPHITEVRRAEGPTGTDWVMPALADAHDHGRGLPPLAFGALDQALELWLPALGLRPPIDLGMLAAYALCKLARSGVGAVAHCHNAQDPERAVEEAVSVCAAARQIGVRLAYVVPMSDRNVLGYGDDQEILAAIPEPWRAAVAERADAAPRSTAAQLELVDEIAAAAEGDGISVLYGPLAPQWASDELLEAIAERAAADGRRVHTHLLETELQREWADAHYPQGLVAHLDRIGLLSPNLTVAHGVWLRDDELALLAERGVSVSVNTSSNLRLRSGTAPVARMRAHGVSFAFGMDGMSIDDDEDALRELRLNHLLHGGTGIDPEWGPGEVVARACSVGHAAVDGAIGHGIVKPGAPADLVVLDGEAITTDVIPGSIDELSLLLARACAHHVRRLFVGGKLVVDNGEVVGVDEDALRAEIIEQCRAATDSTLSRLPTVEAHQRALRRFYRSGGHRRTNPDAPPPSN